MSLRPGLDASSDALERLGEQDGHVGDAELAAVCLTPSSSIIVQKGQATASVSAPVAAASRARSSLIAEPRSSIHMCAPPAPQQNVRLPLRAISSGLPIRETISRGAARTSLCRAR